MANTLETGKRPEQTVDRLITAFGLYWENLIDWETFPGRENDCKAEIKSSMPDEETGVMHHHDFTLQRFYGTAYYIKCEISDQKNPGDKKTKLETVEFRMMPTHLENGKILVRHITPLGFTAGDQELDIVFLDQDDPGSLELLADLELNLLCLLAAHCKTLTDLFDPLPSQVISLLDRAYGKADAREMWNTAMREGR